MKGDKIGGVDLNPKHKYGNLVFRLLTARLFCTYNKNYTFEVIFANK